MQTDGGEQHEVLISAARILSRNAGLLDLQIVNAVSRSG